MRVLNLSQHLYVSCLKVLVGVRTKDKPFVRTENSSLVNLWLETLCIMFFLHWEVYVFMELVLNLRNKDLHWFSEKKTFINAGVYVRFSGDMGSTITSSVIVWFCFFRCVGVW